MLHKQQQCCESEPQRVTPPHVPGRWFIIGRWTTVPGLGTCDITIPETMLTVLTTKLSLCALAPDSGA